MISPRKSLAMIAISSSVLLEVHLMRLLSWVKSRGWCNISFNFGPTKSANALLLKEPVQMTYHCLGRLILGFTVGKNARSILWASIITLSILGSRIMKCEKVLNDLFIWNDVGVKLNLSYLNIRRRSRTNLSIRWIFLRVWLRTHKPDGCRYNCSRVCLRKINCIPFFCSPIASSAKRGSFRSVSAVNGIYRGFGV